MIRISAIQIASTSDIEHNLHTAIEYIAQAKAQGAQLVVLPEEFLTLGLTPAQKLAMAEVYQHGPIQAALAACAKQYGIWIIGGTLPIQTGESKHYYSSCLVWNAQGECVARYDKIHLFDVGLANQESYKESEWVAPGNAIRIVDTPFGKIGLAICYDVRFPELFRVFMLNGVDIIVLPSAFTQTTGQVHWEPLLKARAIENLCYVIAPDQIGVRLNGHRTYGHTLVVGPWGDILGCKEHEQGNLIVDLDVDKMRKIRQQFPALSHSAPFIMQALTEGIQ